MKTSKSKFVLYVTAGVLASTMFLGSCSTKDDDEPSLPKIGGYNSSDEVAANDLVAYWSFNDVLTESKQSLTGTAGKASTATGTSFVEGAKGKALKGSANSWVTYGSTGTALPALQSFTVSFWIKTDQFTSGARSLFQLVKGTEFWPNLHCNFEPLVQNDIPNPDTTRIKFVFTNDDAPAWKTQFIETRIAAVGKWTQVVASYDGNSSKYKLYVNGVNLNLADDISNRYGSNPAEGGTALGKLKFGGSTSILFGAWHQQLGATPDSWMNSYEGSLDEFRVYKSAISDADIASLFALEAAGR